MASDGVFDLDEFHEGRGHQTMRAVYDALNKFMTAMWKSRNDVLHDKQSPELQKIRESEVAEITELYTNKQLIGAGDKHYCERPIDLILKKSPSTRRRWIRYMHRARARYKKATRHQTTITSFFRIGNL
jgi:hypothetical protein